MKKIQGIRGMNDVLPEETPVWRYVEEQLQRLVTRYGYQEIRFPVMESTDLFKRSVGEVTDIVEKEMYTFEDRSGDSVTLRPEGTAGCVRAGIEHSLFYNQIQRLWYRGPIFRHERPQKGRYRQFHQFGVEAFGMPGPDIDAEMILMTARMWELFGFLDKVTLQLNSLGTPKERGIYHKLLVNYFTQHFDQLDEDSERRLYTNPLRILDTKNPEMRELVENAPKLFDVLGQDTRNHFETMCKILDEAGVSYQVNPCLVRGLDYYTHTVFEWVSDQLGAQGTICGGGRFDVLVEQMGGQLTPAIGFALGIERLIDLLQVFHLVPRLNSQPEVYFILAGQEAEQVGLLLAEQWRNVLPELNLLTNCGNGSFKSQFKKADKSGAQLALILGDQELNNRHIAVKYLREEHSQEDVAFEDVISFLQKYFKM